MKKIYMILTGFVVLSLAGCGGGGSNDSSGCDTPLDVDYVNQQLTTEPLFTSHQITPANTKLIHEDGNQGKSYDIDRIILSRITAVQGETLAMAYSVYAKQQAPSAAFMAFYIDTDGIDTIGDPTFGAEVLILDPLSDGSGTMYPYYVWKADSWVPGTKLGSIDTTASYFAGCSLALAVYVPWYQGLAELGSTNARGVMKLMTFTNDDPAKPNTPIDTTKTFDFSFP